MRRPVPFRTRKLRPGTAMVLHPTGCGRVARRRTTRTGSPSEHTPQGAFPISGHPRVGVFLASLGLSVSGLPRSAARTAPPQRGEPETSWAPTGYSCRGPVRFGRQPAEYPVRWLRYQHTGQGGERAWVAPSVMTVLDALVKSKAVLDVLAELGPSTAKTISERTGEPVAQRIVCWIISPQSVGWNGASIVASIGLASIAYVSAAKSKADWTFSRSLAVSSAPIAASSVSGVCSFGGDCARCASRHAPVRHCKAMHSWWAIACL